MFGKATWGDVFAGVFLLALVMVLVRPNSLAPSFISEFGSGLTELVTYAVAA